MENGIIQYLQLNNYLIYLFCDNSLLKQLQIHLHSLRFSQV
jgi:hypothetical protein